MTVTYLPVYTVYKNPKDYPGMFVVRRFTIGPGRKEYTPDPHPIIVTALLNVARVFVPDDCVRIPRNAIDDPCILECWV